MAISNVIEKFGKAIFESPFGANRISKDAPELAEIRLAVLDLVKTKSHRASGKNVFPYNVVHVQLRGIPADQAHVFTSDFLCTYFAQELKTSLSRSSYRFPGDLRVELHTTPALPMPGENWLSVEAELEQLQQAGQLLGSRVPAKLTVVSGATNQPEVLLEKTRTNLGRTTEVYRSSGPSRRNDLVFTEDNETNRTVSREHAHILYSQRSGEYRLFNDRTYKGDANCALWIVRDGLGQPVHRGTRGKLLQSGDEIHLGSAILRFETIGLNPAL